MARLLDVLLGRKRTLAEEIWEKCGGPGSRRPGPCPSAVKPQPAQPTQPAPQEVAAQQPSLISEAMIGKINPEVAKQQFKDGLDAIAKSMPSVDELSKKGEELLALAKSGKNPHEPGEPFLSNATNSLNKFSDLFKIFPGGPQGISFTGSPPISEWPNSVQNLFNKSHDSYNAAFRYLYAAESYWYNTNKKNPMSPVKAESMARAGMDKYKARYVKTIAEFPKLKKMVDKMFSS